MKRNNLMKRMAVVALAATMSVGMAVPAMAATTPGATTGDGSSAPEFYANPTGIAHARGISVTSWYVLDSFKDEAKIKFYNATVTPGVDSNNNENKVVTGSSTYVKVEDKDEDGNDQKPNFLLTKDGKLYVGVNKKADGTYEKYERVDDFTAVAGVQSAGNGVYTYTLGNLKSDSGFYVAWTLTPVNKNYFDASVKDNSLTLKANEFGTTVYKYTGVLYHNGQAVSTYENDDAQGYFAVSMPLLEGTINEVVNDNLTVAPSDASNSKLAATAGKNVIARGLAKRSPKMLNFNRETRAFSNDVMSWENKDHALDVAVDNVTNYHLDTATSTGSYKAHVVVTDTTTNDKYDLGIKTFLIKADDTPVFDDV